MSIVPCPQCGKRISTQAPICDHCGYSSDEADEEASRRFRERKLRTRIYRLNMATYAVMTTVIMAFAWYWIDTGGFYRPADTRGPWYLMIVAAVAYLVVRVLLFRARREKRAVQNSG